MPEIKPIDNDDCARAALAEDLAALESAIANQNYILAFKILFDKPLHEATPQEIEQFMHLYPDCKELQQSPDT